MSSPSELLTIRQVAEHTGLSAHTLRYYERIGLITAVARNSGGHRLYAARDLDWIAFLLRLRATDMPIAGMLEFAALRRQGESSIAQRRILLQAHHERISGELARRMEALAVIAAKISHYGQLEEAATREPESAPDMASLNPSKEGASHGTSRQQPLSARMGKTAGGGRRGR